MVNIDAEQAVVPRHRLLDLVLHVPAVSRLRADENHSARGVLKLRPDQPLYLVIALALGLLVLRMVEDPRHVRAGDHIRVAHLVRTPDIVFEMEREEHATGHAVYLLESEMMTARITATMAK